MYSMSQTVRLLKNVGFNVGDSKGPSCVMALSDVYDDVGVSVFPSIWSEDPGTAKALLNT